MTQMDNPTTKLQAGTWDQPVRSASDRPPKIDFELGKSYAISFPGDFTDPREFPSQDGGVFYVFDPVTCDGEEKAIVSSAITLINGLKAHRPLAGKTFAITKKMQGSKQEFEVIPVVGDQSAPAAASAKAPAETPAV